MQVVPLSGFSLDEVVACFLESFSDYFVEFPTNIEYYRNRWSASKVDFDLSFGMSNEGQLVALILHAIDNRNGSKWAYNAGTGCIPEFRRKGLTKKLYHHAMSVLRKSEIDHCLLEVIIQNHGAIELYKSLGFQIERELICLKGDLPNKDHQGLSVRKVTKSEIHWSNNERLYAWEAQRESLSSDQHLFFNVYYNGGLESSFVLSADRSAVKQWNEFSGTLEGTERLFGAIASETQEVKMNNIDCGLNDEIQLLHEMGMEETVSQYEMILSLN